MRDGGNIIQFKPRRRPIVSVWDVIGIWSATGVLTCLTVGLVIFGLFFA